MYTTDPRLLIKRFATSFFVFFILFSSKLYSQIDIKSKVDIQTYAEYSIAIDLFEKNINSNDVATLFIPINYSLNRLQQDKYDKIFVQNDSNEINMFLQHHLLIGYLTENEIKQNLIGNNKLLRKTFKSANDYNLVMNGDLIMLTDGQSFECNVEKSLILNSKIIIHFIRGFVNY